MNIFKVVLNYRGGTFLLLLLRNQTSKNTWLRVCHVDLVDLHVRVPDLVGLEGSPSGCIFKELHSDSGIHEPDTMLGASWEAGTI